MDFPDEAALDEALTRPSSVLTQDIRQLRSPLVVLGAGGKMGPTLAVLAHRAARAAGYPLDVVAVSRFRDAAARAWIESQGVRTVSADLLEEREVAALPDAGDVAYLVGVKFGTTSDPSATWAANTIVPIHIARRYPGSRIVALSTGNVYPFTPTEGTGASEAHPLTPIGEYANAAIARERVLEWHSRRNGTPMVLVRLSYAVEARYGVLHDLASRIWRNEPVDVANGFLNCIWQADANEAILRLFPHATSPALPLNLTGTRSWRVRDLASQLAVRLGREARFEGQESPNALLSNVTALVEKLGPPATGMEAMLDATAAWIRRGGRSLGKPTHFEVRDGKY